MLYQFIIVQLKIKEYLLQAHLSEFALHIKEMHQGNQFMVILSIIYRPEMFDLEF